MVNILRCLFKQPFELVSGPLEEMGHKGNRMKVYAETSDWYEIPISNYGPVIKLVSL